MWTKVVSVNAAQINRPRKNGKNHRTMTSNHANVSAAENEIFEQTKNNYRACICKLFDFHKTFSHFNHFNICKTKSERQNCGKEKNKLI